MAGPARARVTLATRPRSRDQARKKAGDILAGRRLGDDERQKIERRKTEAAATTERTLADLITAYRDHVIGRQKPRTRIETNRHLDKHWLPLHRLLLARIDRATVAARLLELAKASGPVAANRARAALSAVFAWGMGAGLAEHNPVAGTVRNDEASRDRVLTGDELRTIWRATEGRATSTRSSGC